jgi:hypothetical protein
MVLPSHYHCYGIGVRQRLPLLSLIFLLPMLVAWPLPVVWASEWLTVPAGEAAVHVWGLWVTSANHSFFTIETFALSWPNGIQAVLADPANIPWFVLGWTMGPAAAYNTVVYANLVLLGISGAALAKRVGGSPALGVIAACTNASILAATTTGITEHLGVGWIGLMIACLLRSLDKGCKKSAMGAGVLLFMCAASGPYCGVWASLIASAIGIAHVIRKDRLRFFVPLGITALVGGVLVAPLAKAIMSGRIAGQPGTAELASQLLNRPANHATMFRGGLRFGADLTDSFVPVMLTGGAGLPNQTTYIGLVALLTSVFVCTKRKALWPWLVGSALFVALSWGPWLIFKGNPITLDGAPLLAPAGILAKNVSFFSRISHWQRAASVAALLLVPLVSLLPTLKIPKIVPWAIAGMLLADHMFGSPLPWPLPSTPSANASTYAPLAQEKGSVLVLPKKFYSRMPHNAAWRDPAILAQLHHQRPISEAGTMGHEQSTNSTHAADIINHIGLHGLTERGHRNVFRDADFRWLAVYKRHVNPDPVRDKHWVRCIGNPVAEDDVVVIYRLSDGIKEWCLGGSEPSAVPLAP